MKRGKQHGTVQNEIIICFSLPNALLKFCIYNFDFKKFNIFHFQWFYFSLLKVTRAWFIISYGRKSVSMV